MVGAISNFSITSNQSNLSTYGVATVQATSVDALHGDPDLLIKEYFRSSPEQRAKSRAKVASLLKSYKSILAILELGYLSTTKDAFDGAVDLLAECKDFSLFGNTVNYLLPLSSWKMKDNSLQFINAHEIFWGILIKGIGCAYHLSSQSRLVLLHFIVVNLSPIMNRRSIKAVFLDSLANIGVDLEEQEIEEQDWIKQYINWVARNDRDEYIRDYAQETLAELM